MRHNGVFIGDEQCAYWGGVDHMENRVCCGGKVSKIACVTCSKKGVIKAFSENCNSTCLDRVFKPVRVDGDPLRRIESEPLFKEAVVRPKASVENGKAVVTYVVDGVTHREEKSEPLAVEKDAQSGASVGV